MSCFMDAVYSFFNVYLFLRERERVGALARAKEWQRERERRRIPNRLHTVSAEPNLGLKLTNHEIMT